MECLDADKNKEYNLDPKDVYKVIERRAKLPEYLNVEHGALQDFMKELTNEGTGKVNYRDMVDSLRDFD